MVVGAVLVDVDVVVVVVSVTVVSVLPGFFFGGFFVPTRTIFGDDT